MDGWYPKVWIAKRRVRVPVLVTLGVREQWLTLAIQRCTAHKLRNLEAKAPMRVREELAEDYRG